MVPHHRRHRARRARRRLDRWIASQRGAATHLLSLLAVAVGSTPLVRNFTLRDDQVGRFRACQAVEVRPRVPGMITVRSQWVDATTWAPSLSAGVLNSSVSRGR
jgi:hypothetical protein